MSALNSATRLWRSFQSSNKTALHSYGYQFATMAIGLVSGTVIARTLGPAEKGIVDLFNVLSALILELGTLGLGSGLLYALTTRKHPLERVHGTAIAFSLVAGLAAASVGLMGFKLWRSMFPGLPTWSITLAFALAPLAFYRLIWSNLVLGLNRALLSYQLVFHFGLLQLIAVAFLYALGSLNAKTAIAIMAVLTVLFSVISYANILEPGKKLQPSYPIAKEGFSYGFLVYLTFVANLLHFKTDQILLNRWIGSEAVGIYAVAVRWAEMLFMLDGPLAAIALYKISTGTREESHLAAKKTFIAQLKISGASAAFLALIAYPLILFLYGESYVGAVAPLIGLLPGIVFWSAAKTLSNMLVYREGMARHSIAIAFAGLLMNLALNYLFIRKMGLGIAGTALASSISYFFVCGTIFLLWLRVKGIHAREARQGLN